jgi:hypothetical protein
MFLIIYTLHFLNKSIYYIKKKNEAWGERIPFHPSQIRP